MTKSEAAKELLKRRKARNSFWEFRKIINGEKFIRGWWAEEVSNQLQLFYEEWRRGTRPKLVLEAPPQHGKTSLIVDLVAWVAGKDPDAKTIYTSFSERLGIRANLALQRMYSGRRYRSIFPETNIPTKNSVTVSGQKLRNREIIEYIEADGFFRNTTVGGAITGESLDLGIIDDPIRGRKDANSPTVRQSVWDWFTDDFFSRFSDSGAMLAILTRWHTDDPIGRLKQKYGHGIKTLSYPAIAIANDEFRKKGDPLFSEHKSLEFLLERKSIMSESNWEALYQQNPYIASGETFKAMWWGTYRTLPPIAVKRIYGDTAQKTRDKNDYTVFECWGRGFDNQLYLIDLIRDKFEAPELLVAARAFYNKHNTGQVGVNSFKVEDKVSGTGLIQTLVREGIPMVGIQRNTDKLMRADDASPIVESGICNLPENAPWLSEFLTEVTQFPNAKNDDQVDPMIDAVMDLTGSNAFNYEDLL